MVFMPQLSQQLRDLARFSANLGLGAMSDKGGPLKGRSPNPRGSEDVDRPL